MPDEETALVARHFDAVFYRQQCADAGIAMPADADALLHYMAGGWRRALDPCAAFSTQFYLARSRDVRDAGINPFYHYLRWGCREGRAAHPGLIDADPADEIADYIGASLDRDFYLRAHPHLVANNVDPLRHYVAFGWEMGWDPTPEFSTAEYLERNPDVRSNGINPFYHYLRYGRHEGRAPTGAGTGTDADVLRGLGPVRAAFDPGFYLDRYREVGGLDWVDPFLHYLHFGWRRGFDPSAGFATRFYLARNPDVCAQDEDPLTHYVLYGRLEGRMPTPPADLPEPETADLLASPYVRAKLSPVFDGAFYRALYPELRGMQDALGHYLADGWREGRDPAPWFSTANYLKRYPGVAAMAINPLLHYVLWGRAQEFSTHEGEGPRARLNFDGAARIVTAVDLNGLMPPSLTSHAPTVRSPSADAETTGGLSLHWVIPEFDAGRGGHMTIFRIIKWLELFGHRCTIWVHGANDRSPAQREELLLRHYQVVRARVRILPAVPSFDGADALIATRWDTATLVSRSPGPRARFYFVQDYEPSFYPAGTRFLAAQDTYGLGLTCICAGEWLARRMRAHGSEAHSFVLAADEVYSPPAARPANAVPRIAFYARAHTTRRAVELGLLAFEILAARGVAFHVDLFGAPEAFDAAPFSATDWGVVDALVLARLYRQADLGICFSATNHSLVPQEMMACGLPVLELDTEAARETFPAEVVALARPNAVAVADRIAALLADASGLRSLAGRGLAWARSLSWEDAAGRVEAALRAHLPAPPAPPCVAVAAMPPQATVVIPTLDGGALFRRVLDRVLAQRTGRPFEVVVIDSSSTDGTWEHLRAQADRHRDRLRVHRIDRAAFQHGRTRNLGIGMAAGEVVAFLTQDALPADHFWLENLVLMLERFPRAAGVVGRHLAWPEASAFVHRDTDRHFATLDHGPLAVSKYDDLARWRAGDLAFRRFLHFYSDNSSCLRRSVWERHPYPEVEYGEDQLWAHRIIAAGYEKLYAPRAVIFHSHDYDEAQTFERARIEAAYFRRYFGYDMAPPDPETELGRIDAEDERWGVRHGVPPDGIAQRKRLNGARIRGTVAGAAISTR